MRLLTVCLITLASTATTACGSDSEPSETTSDVGIANPASAFCVAQGGTIEIVDEPGGQVGYCTLPDGTRVEEWAYFRSQGPTASTEP